MEERCSWSPAPDSRLQLSPQEVHVWRVWLEQDEIVFAKLRALLSEDEQARAAQFKFEKLKKRFIVARGALRNILSRYLGVAADKIVFEYESHGKPKLSEAVNASGGISFNLSHAENLALCAVTCGCAIGVDVEFIRPLDDAEKIARRFFSPRESQKFCALPAAQKPAAFFNCWTRKEAFIKALGEGLSHSLHRFEVSFLDDEPVALLSTRPDPQEAAKWMLGALAPARDYVGAFAVKEKKFQLKCWQWQMPSALNHASSE
jgi:4'-phosphopantetheinyl transferase